MSWIEINEFARSIWPVWLMLIFLGIIAWVLRPGAGRMYRDQANIPLNDDPEDTPGRNEPTDRRDSDGGRDDSRGRS